MDARVVGFKLNCSSPVTAFTYHPLRREVVTGHEDGLIKTWDADTGKATLSLRKHEGMITDLLYWASGRLLISSSVDGSIIQWAPSGAINGVNDIGRASYSLCWYPKLNGLVVGCLCSLSLLLPSGKHGTMGLPLLTRATFTISSHLDIIRCIETDGNKLFSAGYDKRLCVYDAPGLHGKQAEQLHLLYMKERAHEAAVTCLWVDSETDWVFTGSFDRQVKIWTSDIKPLHTLQFLDTITDVAFVPETKVLWVSTEGSNTPFHFEPKSGDKITDYLDPAAHSMRIGANSIRWQSFIQHMRYTPDTSELIAITSSKEVVLLRYSQSATVCCQQLSCPVQCLTYTKKIPILLFTGNSNGEMVKWERLQLNPFMYSKETLLYKDFLKHFLETDSGGNNFSFFLYKSEKGGKEDLSEAESERAKIELMKDDYRGYVKTVFLESLDYLVSSARDGKIFVWGFDKKAAAVLRSMDQHSLVSNTNSDQQITHEPSEEELVTYDRVAGFICVHVLNGHNGPVQALAAVEKNKNTKSVCLLSAGWDLTICIWQLDEGRLAVQVNDCIPASDRGHYDLIITDIAYNSVNDTFAFSTSNGNAYLMSFSLKRSEVELLATLKSHTDEVTQVCWNPCNEKWVTGSEDSTICVWSSDGTQCENTLATRGPVSVICVDTQYNLLVVGVNESIKVYNESLDVVQVYHGHTAVIQSIILVPELSQYISASQDCTLRVWNSFKPKELNKKATGDGPDGSDLIATANLSSSPNEPSSS